MRLARLSAVACIALACPPVLAADWYVSAHVGVSSYNGVASTDQLSAPLEAGASLPIDGVAFDGDETTYGVRLGWQARSWLALEFGYSDLGDIGTNLPPLNISEPGILTSGLDADILTQPSIFTSVPGAVLSPAFGTTPFRPASLASDQWHVGAKLSAPLRERLSGHWYLGLGRTSYDVEGALRVVSLSTFDSGDFLLNAPTQTLVFPNETPDSETALIWGFGFDYQLREDIALDLSWRRHDNDVLAADTITLGVIWRPAVTFR